MSRLKRGLPAILIGMVEAYLVMLVLSRNDFTSLSDFLIQPALFFLASIVCTAGVSLVLWLPLLWAIGTVTRKLARSLVPADRLVGAAKREAAADHRARMTTDRVQVRVGDSDASPVGNYVESMRRDGVPDETIRDRLARAGWSDADIAVFGLGAQEL